MAQVFPHIDFRREVTIGHLVLDTNSKAGVLAKVNPPIRPREDVEFLWQMVLENKVDWVVSDHACCRHETKAAKNALGNIWLAKSGFGGTEYLLPALISEGSKRKLSLNRIAALTSGNPAQALRAELQGRHRAGPRRRPRAGRPDARPGPSGRRTRSRRRATRRSRASSCRPG